MNVGLALERLSKPVWWIIGIVLITLVRLRASSISRSSEFVVRTRRRCDSGKRSKWCSVGGV